jgi:hypothetical protein
LNQDGKEKAGEMDVLDGLVSDTQQGSENEKEYPEEMNKDDGIGKILE